MPATLKNLPSVSVNLSHLPADVQAAVGPEIAQTLVKQLAIGDAALIVGKLGPGIYGYINPDFLEKQLVDQLDNVLKAGIK